MKHILFIGDSITDAGRTEDREEIGNGYVRLLHDYLNVSWLDKEFKITNKGISGNRVNDLEKRWQEDVIALQPDVVSVSIGINDVWRQLDNPGMEQIYPDRFKAIYEILLQQVKESVNPKILLMEPTLIGEETNSEGNLKLKPYVEIVRELAVEYQATLVPTHEAFMRYLETGRNHALTTDGVHMTLAGNMLMADTWLKAAKKILL